MLLSIDNVYKYFNGEAVLQNICAAVENNDRIGLVGKNGCGKSTLLKIITGKEDFDRTPDGKGAVSFFGKASVGFLEQNSGLEMNGTILQEMKKPFAGFYEILEQMKNLEQQMPLLSGGELDKKAKEYAELAAFYEAKDGYNIDVKINTVLNGMGFADKQKDTAVQTLSGGEKTRLALCKLLLSEPELLILDEPTNHLDLNTLTWLEDYLKGYKGAVLVVSHDRYFLDRLCNKIWHIANTKLKAYKGNYTAFAAKRELDLIHEQKEYQAQREQIAKLEDYIARNKVRASTANMAKSREKQLEKMVLLKKPESYEKPPKIKLEYDIRPPELVLSVKGLDVTVGSGNSSRTLVQDLNFEVRRGQRLAIIGQNGTGKTSLIKTLLGRLSHNGGKINWADNVKTFYFEQENTMLDMNNTVIDEVRNRFPGLSDLEIRNVLASVLFTGENVFKPIGVISGGERVKLCFAIMMLKRANVLVLDEPTNHLDLLAKEVFEEALDSFDGTMLLVSHDRYLLNKIPDRMLELREDGAEFFEGGYDSFLAVKKRRQSEEERVKRQTDEQRKQQKREEQKRSSYRTREQRALDAKRKLKVKELEGEIEQLESEITSLESEISAGEFANDYEKITELCICLDEKKNLLNEKMEQWAELA